MIKMFRAGAPDPVQGLITWHGHVAMSSQGTQDHLGAKSANWLAGCVVNLVSNFPISSQT